jgi:type VI protein secretion system component VasF
MIRQIWIALVSLALEATLSAQEQPPASPDGFVPLSSLPPGEQLPAAPFLIGSYAFFLVLMLFYLWTIWNRLSKVETEMQALERRQGGAAR